MSTTSIKNGFQGGSDDQLKVNPDGSINVTGGSARNPSVGTNGDPAPASSTLAAGTDPSGNLKSLQTDASGNLKTVGFDGGFDTLSPGYPTQVSVSTTSILLLPANNIRKYAHIANNSSNAIFIQYNVSAALNQGIKIGPGGFYTLDTANLYRGDINAIGLMNGQFIDVLEGI